MKEFEVTIQLHLRVKAENTIDAGTQSMDYTSALDNPGDYPTLRGAVVEKVEEVK